MKTLPKLPYIQNIVAQYHREGGNWLLSGTDNYRQWLRQFGFSVPIRGDYLEFPDDFPDEKLTWFILRWA